MAEIAGLVIGGVSMAALVEVCTNAIERVESIKGFGRDYQKAMLKLSLLELRLTRWATGVAETVRHKNLVIGSSEEAQHVRDLLGDIASTMREAERRATRYDNSLPIEALVEDDKDEATFDYLASKVKTMALRRQKVAPLRKKTWWALRDQSKLNRLINDLNESMNELETVFPPDQMLMIAESQKSLAKAEATELIQPSELVEPIDGEVLVSMLEDAAHGVDETLKKAVQTAAPNARIGRHSFGDIRVSDHASIFVGDYVAAGQTVSGTGHNYGRLEASGNSRVHYGDSFGGRSVFDD